MPLEDWIPHCVVARFLYDWQTGIAGLLAALAGFGAVMATIIIANRQIAASRTEADKVIAATREQTSVTSEQTATTVRLERDRLSSEAKAFRAMLEAAMERVLSEAASARETYPQLMKQDGGQSPQALIVRNSITRGAFAELRAACIRQGSPLTGEFLDLEREIENFAMQWVDVPSPLGLAITFRQGLHARLGEQLAMIEAKATKLRQEAAEK